MKPNDWKKLNKFNNQQIAEKLSAVIGEPIHQETVRRVCHGAIPSEDVVTAWFEISGGLVTPNDFYDLPEPPLLPSNTESPVTP